MLFVIIEQLPGIGGGEVHKIGRPSDCELAVTCQYFSQDLGPAMVEENLCFGAEPTFWMFKFMFMTGARFVTR